MPVNIGPFQRITEVGWHGNAPTVLVVQMDIPAMARIENRDWAYVITADIQSAIAVGARSGEVRYGNPLLNDLNGFSIGFTTITATLVNPGISGSIALAVDFREIRKAYAAHDEDLTEPLGLPPFFDVQITGLNYRYSPTGLNYFAAATVFPLTFSLYSGADAVAYARTGFYPYYEIQVDYGGASIVKQTTGIFNAPIQEGTAQFGRGLVMRTARVFTDRLGFTLDNEDNTA